MQVDPSAHAQVVAERTPAPGSRALPSPAKEILQNALPSSAAQRATHPPREPAEWPVRLLDQGVCPPPRSAARQDPAHDESPTVSAQHVTPAKSAVRPPAVVRETRGSPPAARW